MDKKEKKEKKQKDPYQQEKNSDKNKEDQKPLTVNKLMNII